MRASRADSKVDNIEDLEIGSRRSLSSKVYVMGRVRQSLIKVSVGLEG